MLDSIAQNIVDLTFADLPPESVDTAKEAILDTIGVTLAGAYEPAAQATLRALQAGGALGGGGGASLLGRLQGASALDAALVNGVASHALDFDDCSNTLGGHPSAPIVPALWALAEVEGASGEQFIAAYVAGFETETRIGRAVNFHHYEKGWHPTSTLGTFGAAAACAHLMGLDAGAVARALSIAASMASGIKANFGTMTKPYHVGHCARNGLLAALLAREGLTANPGALSDPQGFFEVYNGAGNYDAARALEGWGEPFDIVETGVAFKRHPCCASTHPAIDALLALRVQHGFTEADVAHVLSWTHPRRLKHTNRPDPKGGLDGKFSVQYVLARALRHGIVSLEHFSDAAVSDPDVRAVMTRIEAQPHPQARMDTTEHFFAEVTVTLRDGRQLSHRVERPVGRDREHPLPPGVLHAKFRDCAERRLPAAQAGKLLESLVMLENVDNLGFLSPLLRGQA
jgi:2-methylcitrate dehydratase PrpD